MPSPTPSFLPFRSSSDLNWRVSSLRWISCAAEIRVGRREVERLLAGVGDADLVDDHVELAGLQARDDAAPFGRDEFRLHAELGRDGLGDIHVEADQLTLRRLGVERRERAFEADAQRAALLDLIEQVFRVGGDAR